MDELDKAKEALAQEVRRYSMAGVIGFLETEWFTWQDQREKWELEKREMQRQIDALQQKNLALENVQYDLVRRIKMLEYALVQERARYSGATPEPEAAKEELTKQLTPLNKPERKSKGILERYLHEFELRTANLLSTVDLRTVGEGQEPNPGPPPRFLASLLATKGEQDSSNTSSLRPGTSSLPKLKASGENGTPKRSATPDKEEPSKMDSKKKANLMEAMARLKGSGKGGEPKGSVIVSGVNNKKEEEMEDDFKAQIEKLRQSRREEKERGEQGKEKGNEASPKQKKKKKEEEEEEGNTTTVFKLSKSVGKSAWGKENPVDSLGQLLGLEMELPTEVGDSVGSLKRATKSWQPQFILRHHLDVVRSVSFHEDDPILLSGSDDCTVKLWNWRSAGTVGFKQPLSMDIEPVYIYLGHTAPVYSVVMASKKKQCFSAGADTNVRIWRLPDSTQQDLYAERGQAIAMSLGVLKGHTDAIWDLAYHGHNPLLLSASADATVKLWNINNAIKGNDSLQHTCYHPANEPTNDDYIPTTTCFVPTDVHKFLVGYRTSQLGLFDIETGQVVTLMEPTNSASAPRVHTQMNKVASHPHLALAISAHEDRTIKFWDLKSGQCVHSMIAHQTVVSSLAIDPAGGYVLTAGHGCSLRFWEISSKNCVQEIHAHRQKHDEGIYGVAYHPTLEMIASGGADAMIRVYQ